MNNFGRTTDTKLLTGSYWYAASHRELLIEGYRYGAKATDMEQLLQSYWYTGTDTDTDMELLLLSY